MLIESAAEQLREAERLAAEGGDEAAAAPAAPAPAANGEMADPGTGLEHVAGEAGGEEEGEEASMSPAQQAQHFAMRNLMNAAGVLDGLQQARRWAPAAAGAGRREGAAGRPPPSCCTCRVLPAHALPAPCTPGPRPAVRARAGAAGAGAGHCRGVLGRRLHAASQRALRAGAALPVRRAGRVAGNGSDAAWGRPRAAAAAAGCCAAALLRRALLAACCLTPGTRHPAPLPPAGGATCCRSRSTSTSRQGGRRGR